MRFDKEMLAYCGIYCEQCSCRAVVADRDIKHADWFPEGFKAGKREWHEYKCEGCKGKKHFNQYCAQCKIKECASGKGFDSCAECDGFPCEILRHFEKDGIPHHQWALDNLRSIRENGIESWFENLTPAMRCHCGKRQSWYHLCPEHAPKKEEP